MMDESSRLRTEKALIRSKPVDRRFLWINHRYAQYTYNLSEHNSESLMFDLVDFIQYYFGDSDFLPHSNLTTFIDIDC